MTEPLIEELANVQHEIWSHWMKYLFSVSHIDSVTVISLTNTSRWQRQMNTPYSKLTEKEKESDRDQACKVLAILKVRKALAILEDKP